MCTFGMTHESPHLVLKAVEREKDSRSHHLPYQSCASEKNWEKRNECCECNKTTIKIFNDRERKNVQLHRCRDDFLKYSVQIKCAGDVNQKKKMVKTVKGDKKKTKRINKAKKRI